MFKDDQFQFDIDRFFDASFKPSVFSGQDVYIVQLAQLTLIHFRESGSQRSPAQQSPRMLLLYERWQGGGCHTVSDLFFIELLASASRHIDMIAIYDSWYDIVLVFGYGDVTYVLSFPGFKGSLQQSDVIFLQDSSTCSYSCLHPLRHSIHIADDHLSEIWLC